jgi:hypothetical protein
MDFDDPANYLEIIEPDLNNTFGDSEDDGGYGEVVYEQEEGEDGGGMDPKTRKRLDPVAMADPDPGTRCQELNMLEVRVEPSTRSAATAAMADRR